MIEATYEGKNFNLLLHLSSKTSINQEVERIRKAADKGAFTCPYCEGTLGLRAGEVNEKHFYHRKNSCAISDASEVYQQQIKREAKSHSVIKDIIYDELKTQEKINPGLHVEYGFIDKAEEKWKHYPDIIVKNDSSELAITVLTDVTANKDAKLVRQIKKRNEYFKSKNLVPIWFVEEAEQSIDTDYRVVHLWEAELDIATKTEEDMKWDSAIKDLKITNHLFDIFEYHYRVLPSKLDVSSLYYVKSTETNIVFTVLRFIKDQIDYPYRAFVLTEPYEIKIGTALLTESFLQLSDPEVEIQQREDFLKEAAKRDNEYEANIQQEITHVPVLREKPLSSSKKYGEFSVADILYEYIKEVEVVSANKVSEYLVEECGAPSQTYSTGRYEIYGEVCMALIDLEREGEIKLVMKDLTDSVYKTDRELIVKEQA